MGNSSNQTETVKVQLVNQWMAYEEMISKNKLSTVEPFTESQMNSLQDLFGILDKKNLNSIQIKDLDQILCLRSHSLFKRIKDIFEDDMKKIKAKRINFQLFLYLFSIFHVKTLVQNKVKYLFRLYDCDKNMKIDSNDLLKVYKMTYKMPFLQQEDYFKLVTETLIKYGNKGEIRLENVMQLVPQDEVREIMSFKFDKNFR